MSVVNTTEATMSSQNQQPFPNDSEAESCDECGGDGLVTRGLGGGYFDDECPYCDGTGRGIGWTDCEDCGETTWDHETGAYQQCQRCRLDEYRAHEMEKALPREVVESFLCNCGHDSRHHSADEGCGFCGCKGPALHCGGGFCVCASFPGPGQCAEMKAAIADETEADRRSADRRMSEHLDRQYEVVR